MKILCLHGSKVSEEQAYACEQINLSSCQNGFRIKNVYLFIFFFLLQVTHHVTEKRSRSLTRTLSNKFVEPLSNIRSLSLSFLSDYDKKKRREQDHSQERRSSPTNKEKSREFRFKDLRRKENSLEKTKFTYHDHCSGINSFQFKDSCREFKKVDLRKISKQNTYVLQNSKTAKQTEKKPESESSNFLSVRSVENMDYSRVIDDISPISVRVEEGENHYTEICPQNLRKKGSVKSDGPFSKANISNIHSKKNKEVVYRKFSGGSSISSDNARLRSHGSLSSQICINVLSGSENNIQNRNINAHGHKCYGDDFCQKDRMREINLSKVFREKIYDKNTAREPTSERVLEKDKNYEVCCEDTAIRDKIILPKYKNEDKKYLVNGIANESLVDKLNKKLKDSSESARLSNRGEHVNEVYIIRVVVKDSEEENQMSTLAKDNSGGSYMKIRGFEMPKEEMENVILKDGYDSLC